MRSPASSDVALWLNPARLLRIETILSLIDISLACGFVSAWYCYTCYRYFFGLTAIRERAGPVLRQAERAQHARDCGRARQVRGGGARPRGRRRCRAVCRAGCRTRHICLPEPVSSAPRLRSRPSLGPAMETAPARRSGHSDSAERDLC